MVLLPERECTTCTARQKVLWGCNAPPVDRMELDGDVLDRCPRRPLLDNPSLFVDIFWLFRNYDRGILPEEGSLLSQPHKLVRIFEALDNAKNSANAEQMSREQKKSSQRHKHASMQAKAKG
jgi:hypothetical protein